MDFISNKEPQIKEMLRVIGVASVEDLFVDIPEKIKIAKRTVNSLRPALFNSITCG